MPQYAEANLSALIESTDDLIWSVNLNYELVAFNRAFQKAFELNFGIHVEPGMRRESLLPPERAAIFPPLYKRAISEGPFRFDYLLRDGRTLELSFNPILVGGKATGVSVFGKDISKHKHAEAQLRDSEERFRATFEQAPLGIVHVSFEGVILRCNARFAQIIGYPAEEAQGITIQQITAPEDLARNVVSMERVSRGAGPEAIEKRYIRSDGSLVWVKTTVAMQRDGVGRPDHLIAFVEDINARKEAEKLLTLASETILVSEERYRTVFETSPDAVMISRISDGVILDVNQSFLDSAGFLRGEVIGRTSKELGIWVDEHDLQIFVDTLLRNSKCREMEVLSRRKNGEIFWMRLSASLIEIGGCLCRLTFAQDVSEAKAATDALRVSEERYRTVFETSPDAITIIRLSDTLFIDVNQVFLDILGFEREDVLGKTSQELGIWADDHDRQAMVEIIRQNSGCRALEAQFREKNGEIVWGEVSASVIEIDGVACILSLTRDITSAKAAEKTIRSLAFYDPLTGLPNRRQFLEQLRQTLAASARSGHLLALLLVDLDHFKTFNDTLGHQIGDLLLKEVARRVVASVHEGGTACRLGGDEFAVMLIDLSEVAEEAAAQAKVVGENVLAAIDQPYPIENREYHLTASIGLTIFGGRQKGTDDVLQQADIAMDQAKAAGRNTVRFFSPALQAAVNARAAIEVDLRQAIKSNQFLLFYQPQVVLGRVTGVEALIRWNHPVRGPVLPDEFISLAEESRLILPLGDWVLETACAQSAAWADRELTSSLSISVNISALQFRQPEFVEQVLSALSRTGANPQNLMLELTESMLVEDIEEVIAKMTQLRLRGLRFSLDDFGTGYSSLAYLKRLPLNSLKIDRTFVRDILADSTSGAIAQTIISLGWAMGMSVIAEGVETEEQRGFLAGLGCHSFQGFLFSPPLPVEQFEAFLQGSAESRRFHR